MPAAESGSVCPPLSVRPAWLPRLVSGRSDQPSFAPTLTHFGSILIRQTGRSCGRTGVAPSLGETPSCNRDTINPRAVSTAQTIVKSEVLGV